METKPLIRQIKRIPIFFLVLILFFAAFKIIHDVKAIGGTITLDVSIMNLKERTYKSVEFGENSFTTGMNGTLRLDAALFFMVYRMN